jgi:hypothetical protein
MKRYFTFLLIAVILVGCAGHGRGGKHGDTGGTKHLHTQLGAPAEGAVPLEEYPVLDALLNSLAVGDIKMLVIGDHTVSFGSETDSAAIASRLGVPKEVVEDYAAKNKSETPLEERFDLTVDYVLLSDEDFDRIFSAEDHGGWDRFYRKYPKSAGYIQVSRPGFNKDKTLALVYLGNQRNWLAGTGEYIVLEKSDGAWKIKTRDMIWIS